MEKEKLETAHIDKKLFWQKKKRNLLRMRIQSNFCFLAKERFATIYVRLVEKTLRVDI
jgi:hypothetical protein